MKNEWTLVTKEDFQEFNKKNFLSIVNHRKDFKFYGNATHTALSKMNFRTDEYYIKTYKYETFKELQKPNESPYIEMFSEKFKTNLSIVDFVKMNQLATKFEIKYLGNEMLSDNSAYAIFLDNNNQYYCTKI